MHSVDPRSPAQPPPGWHQRKGPKLELRTFDVDYRILTRVGQVFRASTTDRDGTVTVEAESEAEAPAEAEKLVRSNPNLSIQPQDRIEILKIREAPSP